MLKFTNMPLDKDELAALVQVVETGSYRAAAETLKRAQSSISYAIKNLEKDLQMVIFVKGTYRPQLTAEGELILKKARHLLKMQDELMDYAQSINCGLETYLRLIVTPLYSEDLTSQAIQLFQSKFPQVKIHLTINHDTAESLKLENKTNTIIISHQDCIEHDLSKISLMTIEEIPVSIPRYPAAQEDLTEAYLSSLTELKLNHQVCKETNTWSLNSYEQIKTLINQNLGWAYLPINRVKNEIQTGNFVKIPSLPTKHVNIYLYRAQSIGPAAKYLSGLFSANCAIS